jgi:hypothetical protein
MMRAARRALRPERSAQPKSKIRGFDMDKLTSAFAALAIAAAGWQPPQDEPAQLKEARLLIKHDATRGLASLALEAEAEEAIGQVEVRSPTGAPVLRMQSAAGGGLALSSFKVESEEAPLAALYQACTPGVYEIRARMVAGSRAVAEAVLDHALPAAPVILHPLSGAQVPAGELSVSWLVDPAVGEYRIGLEQGETDGIALTLPPGTGSFRGPAGLLAPGVETKLEVEAVADNGNRTLAEVVFTTL